MSLSKNFENPPDRERRQDTAPATAPARNRFDRMEWAGAFGDLGTLIPFIVAYISLLKVDPYGMILAFGIATIAIGLYYKTPIPAAHDPRGPGYFPPACVWCRRRTHQRPGAVATTCRYPIRTTDAILDFR